MKQKKATKIQSNFGEFNPRFLGVTFYIVNERTYDSFNTMLSGGIPNISSFNHDHRFEFLSLASVLPHEVRHFHDFFLSPYYAYIYARKVQIAVNSILLWGSISSASKRDQCNCVVVPLREWCRLDHTLRQSVISGKPNRKDRKRRKLFDCPHISGDKTVQDILEEVIKSTIPATHKQIMVCAASYQQLNEFDSKMDSMFRSSQIYELSALLMQFENINKLFGESEMEFFQQKMLSQDNQYSAILQHTKAIWSDQHKPFDLTIASLMATWSILGSFSEGKQESPSMRFEKISKFLLREGIPDDLFDAMTLFNDWSMKLGLSNVTSALEESQRTFCTLNNNIKEMLSNKKLLLPQEFKKSLKKIGDGLVETNEHMVEAFLKFPNTYVFPQIYNNSTQLYVNPPLHLVFPEESDRSGYTLVGKSEEEFAEKGYRLLWGRHMKNGNIGARVLDMKFALSDVQFLDLEAVEDMYYGMCLADRLMSNIVLHDPEAIFAGDVFTEDLNLDFLTI